MHAFIDRFASDEKLHTISSIVEQEVSSNVLLRLRCLVDREGSVKNRGRLEDTYTSFDGLDLDKSVTGLMSRPVSDSPMVSEADPDEL